MIDLSLTLVIDPNLFQLTDLTLIIDLENVVYHKDLS